MVTRIHVGLALLLSVSLMQAQGAEAPSLESSRQALKLLLQEKRALAGIDKMDIDMEEGALEFPSERVRQTASIKGRLFYDKEGFFVRKDKEDVRIKKYDTDKLLRGRSVNDMAKYTLLGKVRLAELDSGEYTVQAQGELKGGGPVLASVFYWGTKIGLYSAIAGAAAGTVAATVATAGGAAPLAAGAGAVVGEGFLAATTGVAVGTGIASTALSVGGAGVAAAVGSSAAATAVVAETTVAVGAAGGAAGVITAIEAAAIAAGAFGAACGPF